MVLVTRMVGVPVPAARYTSYEVAVADAGHARVAVVCVAMVVPAAGDVLVTQAASGIAGAAVVNVVVLDTPHAVFAPLTFLGAIYQLYNVPAVNPVAL